MKNNLHVFVLWILAISAIGQGNRNSFLFKKYQPAKVYLTNGLYTEEQVNFNLLENQLYFVDKRDGQMKIIDKSILVDSIRVGARKFLFDPKNGVREQISNNPLVYVRYNSKKKMKGVPAGYGGTSETAKVTSYSELRSDGTEILKDLEFVVIEIDPIYWVVKDGKEKKFIDVETFIKIYPGKKDKLDQYNKDKHVNFKNTADVVALCLYAQKP
jgi:hypothetical protein